MGVRIIITQSDVADATARFLDDGGNINHTEEFPRIVKSGRGKTYGQVANDRLIRKKRERQKLRDHEKSGLS